MPLDGEDAPHRLITIRISHYNEKARWALDRFEVPYVEQGWMPGFHALGVLAMAPRHGVGRRGRHSTPLATPLLATSDGACIRGSSAILRWASDRYARPGEDLYPNARSEALDRRFTDELGPHTRRVAYYWAFQAPELLEAMADANVPPRQARWFKRVNKYVVRMITRSLQVDEARAARSLERSRKVVDDASELLARSPFLAGDRFTAADLSFAALLAPLLFPSPGEGYGATFPPLDACPTEFARIVREVRETTAGRHALRMFREERGRRRIAYAMG